MVESQRLKLRSVVARLRKMPAHFRVPLPGYGEPVDDQDGLLGVESLQVEGGVEPYGSGSDYQDVSIHGVDR